MSNVHPQPGGDGAQDGPREEWREQLTGQGWKAGDAAIKRVSAGWFAKSDESQKLALGALGFAALIGPLGQGLLAAVKALYSSTVPTAEQLGAVLWLSVITLPVFAAAAVVAYLLGKGHIMVILGFGAIAAYFAGAFLASTPIPEQLGEFYCFADVQGGRIVYEQACREFDAKGFVESASTSGDSRQVLSWAFMYTVDARGFVMAWAGVIAGAATGYLVRREAEA